MSNRLTFSLASLFLIFALTFSATFVHEAQANADFEGKTIPDQVFIEDIAIAPLTLPTAKNADSYTLTPPNNMNFDAATRVLSGTPDTVAGRTIYVYTAVDSDANDATISFTIEVKANQAPKFADGAKIDNQVFKVGKDVEGQVTFPAATDPDAGDELTYSLSGTLPAGVQFDPFQRRLIGRPLSSAITTTAETITYTATDKGLNAVTLTFDITAVEADAKPDFTGKSIPAAIKGTIKVDEAITDAILPTATDANAADVAKLVYTLTPSLPDGLEYIQSARLVRGTPTAVKAETEYTYTATDPDGNTAELKFKLTVRADPMFAASASIRDYTFVVGTEVDAGPFPTATDADNDIDAYSLTPDPPDGVTFVASLRKLLGNPTMAQDETEYTYTVTDDAGRTDELTFNITVIAAGGTAPPANGGDTTPPTVTSNAPTDPITGETVVKLMFSEPLSAAPTVTGNPTPELAKYMATVAAVAGENAYNVTITPTPEADLMADVPETEVTFTVAGMDAAGNNIADNTTFMVTLAARTAPAAVADPEPEFPAGTTIGDKVYWVDEENVSIRLPEASDDKPTDPERHRDRYEIMPDLPDGLGIIFIGSHQYIAGSPTTHQDKTEYTWSYTDAGGGKVSLKFSITVLQILAPGKLMGLTAEQDSHVATAESVLLDWDALAMRMKTDANNTGNDGGSPVTHYMVMWTGPSNGTISTANEEGPTATSYLLEQNLPIGEYTFKVAAVNKIDTGAYSDTVTINVANPPSAPLDLDAALNQVSNEVTLTWIAPRSDGGDPISGYVAYITAPDGTEKGYPTNSKDTKYTTSTLTVEGEYVFRVAAMNSCGEGEKSNSDRADVNVLVNKPPVFQQGASIRDITATVGTSISVPLPSATDPEGERIFYIVSPILPAGLNLTFVGGNPAIVGTPRAASPRALHSFIAADFAPAVEDRTTSRLPFYITVNPAIPGASRIDGPAVRLPSMTIPPNGFVVLQRNPAASGIQSHVRSAKVALANLDHLFRDRGGIVLRGPGTAHDLVFSEIMWGSDSALADDSHSQWIELYNTTKGSLNLDAYSLEFHSSGRFVSSGDVIDEINTIGWSDLHGQRGRTAYTDARGFPAQPIEIISMYLKINYTRVEHSQARGEQLKDFPNGSNHGHWAASARPSLNIDSTWRLATPGAKPRFTIHGASTLRQNVIITEVGNSNENDYDWVELYNTTDDVINLKKWELSYVHSASGVGKETSLFRFPDNDSHRLPGKSYLVIASTDPKNSGNDLAAGIDIRKKGIDQVGKGLGDWEGGGSANDKGITALYTVIPFSNPLPNGNARTNIILRHEQGKLGKADKFEDVIGTLSVKLQGPVVNGWTGYDANSETYYNTSFWPLHAIGAPHGNVIDGTDDEDFRAGRVYQRNDLGKGTRTGIHEKDLSIRGWTGVGYDVHADNNAENGGTPGYSKDAVKSKASEVAGTVSISEIMLVTDEDTTAGRVPRATRLPQWVEIYNGSMTQGVNLNNWYLEIQNADSEDLETRNLSGTLRLPNVTIPPNQTILIVSNSGLNSGNFPEERMINLFTNGTYRSILNLRNRSDSFLSQVGFYIELRDHENNHVDEIGNLGYSRRAGTDRRDNFDNEWEMPELNAEDGHRTSLIRVYKNKSAADGLMAGSWRRASDTNFRHIPSLTYFGNHRDYGTPGYRGGGPLPVSLSKFRPERLDDGSIVVRWITESELNNAGFNILRSDTRDGQYTKVNTQLIAGQGTTSENTSYEWKDTTAKPNVVYYYQIQDVSLDGQVTTLKVSRLKGNVTAAGKATTIWGELKALQ